MDKAVEQFAIACRDAAAHVGSSLQLREFTEKLIKHTKGDDVDLQIMSAALANTCWMDSAKVGSFTEEVMEALDGS